MTSSRSQFRLVSAAASALILAACASSQPYSSSPGYGYGPSYPAAPARCYDCGTIERIEIVHGARPNTRTGAVLGGIVGAVAGREIADHNTDSEGRKNTATVAGAVAGAVAGNAIENKMHEQTYDIIVRMDDGRRITVNRNSLGSGVREGAYVRVSSSGRLTVLR